MGVMFIITSCGVTEKEKQEYIKNSQAKRKNKTISGLKEKVKALKQARNEAIETAREFALENTKGLIESKLSYIRFNEPHIYQSKILNGKVMYYNIPIGEGSRKLEIKTIDGWGRYQTIMVWYPPNEKLPVIVAGTSKRNLSRFIPVKIVRERLYISKPAVEKAREKALEFAMNELPFLQDKPRTKNIVRFDDPTIATTNFDLDVKKTFYYQDLRHKEKEEFDRQKLLQASFIWDNEDKTEKIVVAGVWYERKDGKNKSTKGDNNATKDSDHYLSNWIPVKAQIYQATEINEYLVK